MSIEALWAVQFVGISNQGRSTSGGVVVLETGRIFGGDTWQYYTGKYSREDDGRYSVELHTGVHFQAGGESIFGGPLRAMKLVGTFDVSKQNPQKTIMATLTVDGYPEMIMSAVLTRVAELP
jgi:hypothetical protein